MTFPNNCGTPQFTSTVTTAVNAAHIFIAKFDPNGTCLWAKQYGGGGDDEGFGISVDNASNVYITGYFYGSVTFGTKTITSHGQGDVFIVKLNQNGVVQWVVRGGGTGSNFGRSVAIGTRLYLTGTVSNSTSGVSFDSTTGSPCTLPNVTSSGNIFLVKYNPAGVCQVVKSSVGINGVGGYGGSETSPRTRPTGSAAAAT
ncbi:MAG TPA: SBBP repeat-containing protein [Pyrinomonadaceae bacterium]